MLFQPQDFGITLLDLLNGVPQGVGDHIAIFVAGEQIIAIVTGVGADGKIPDFPLIGVSVIIVVRNKAEVPGLGMFQHLGAV